MSCNCVGKVVDTTTNNKCDGCLIVKSMRYSCTDGPKPCGDVLIEDMSLVNDVSACSCGDVTYSIVSFDDGFDSVTVTPGGIITAVTSSTYSKNKEYVIEYKVDCTCSILSANGKLYICKKDMCVDSSCTEFQDCNPCDGSCVDRQSDLSIGEGGTTSHSNGGTSFI